MNSPKCSASSLLCVTSLASTEDEGWRAIGSVPPARRGPQPTPLLPHCSGSWFRDHNIELLPWTAMSCDLNPIEHFWAIFKPGKYCRSKEMHQRQLRPVRRGSLQRPCHVLQGPCGSVRGFQGRPHRQRIPKAPQGPKQGLKFTVFLTIPGAFLMSYSLGKEVARFVESKCSKKFVGRT
jgi:hypothetical protein